MKKNSNKEYETEVTEGTSVLVGILDNLEDSSLQESAKKVLNYLLEFEKNQNDMIKNNTSILVKIKEIREKKEKIVGIICTIFVFLLFFNLYVFIELEEDYLLIIGSLLLGMISFFIGLFLNDKLDRKREKLEEGIYVLDLNISKQDLEFLNDILKNIKTKIETFPIIEYYNRRYIQENGHMVDVTNVSTSVDKKISKFKYYEIEIMKDYQDCMFSYEIHVYEKICYCDKKINYHKQNILK